MGFKDDAFSHGIRRTFFLASLLIPTALLAVGMLGPDAATFITKGGDLAIGIAVIVAIVLARKALAPENAFVMLYITNIGYASILFARSTLLSTPYTFLAAFLWIVVTFYFALRKMLDLYVTLYGLIVHLLVTATLVWCVLAWLHP
jgi:hypothetical protein